jgi:hypothetical protein
VLLGEQRVRCQVAVDTRIHARTGYLRRLGFMAVCVRLGPPAAALATTKPRVLPAWSTRWTTVTSRAPRLVSTCRSEEEPKSIGTVKWCGLGRHSAATGHGIVRAGGARRTRCCAVAHSPGCR